MQEKLGDEQKDAKPALGPLKISAATLLAPSYVQPPKNKVYWVAIAWALSLFIHAALLLISAPELEKLGLEPKNNYVEANMAFKPVVMTLPLDPKRPAKARYYAEKDQSAKRDQISKHTSLTSKALSVAPLEPSKKINHKTKAPTADNFLARPLKNNNNNKDPLGLKALEREEAMPFGEHLPEAASGDHTELNAWAWRHAPFFNRIKTQIGQVWSPKAQIARFDPQGLLLGQNDRVTVVSVTLDSHGQLKNLAVANSSGVAYLDEEAERAFKKAAPFPFVPQDLFNSKDGFTFQFAFHLQLNRGMKFDFEWHQAE